MYPNPDRLTLDALLSDPLTQLVMRSDKITPADVAQAFAEAEAGIGLASPRRRGLAAQISACCGRLADCGGARWIA